MKITKLIDSRQEFTRINGDMHVVHMYSFIRDNDHFH